VSDEPKPYVAGLNSDVRKAPVRVAFITRRTSAAVRVTDEERMMTHPGVFFRILVAIELLTITLTWLALLFDAPLEQLADPMHTPNPAKAPWYFLGLQELLHYFPPVVAGVLIPGLVVLALIVIPYFNVNVEGGGLFLSERARRVTIFAGMAGALCVFFVVFDVWVALAPTLVIALFMALAARQAAKGATDGLAAKPLSFWIMTWFLAELVVLTAVGTFFRGPGWSWVLPWKEY
jgi:quinol-cytochrome oxidoreductase complex cytochrome b subunit